VRRRALHEGRPGASAARAASTSGASARIVNATRGGRVLRQRALRPTRARQELAPAVGTCPSEHRVGALRAKGALERADAGLGRVRGQVAIAALASGA
jgi:hypothetical protein